VGQVADAPREALGGHAGTLVRLPGCGTLLPGPGAGLARRIERALSLLEALVSFVVRRLRLLHRRLGLRKPPLGRDQFAPVVGQVLPKEWAPPRPICHMSIIAGRRRMRSTGQSRTAAASDHRITPLPHPAGGRPPSR
jgi:hypothetical protein